MALSELLPLPGLVSLGALTGLLLWIYSTYNQRWAPKGLRRVPGPRGYPLGRCSGSPLTMSVT